MRDVELDRPGTPGSPGAWDARSEEWLTVGGAEGGEAADGASDAPAGAPASDAGAAAGGRRPALAPRRGNADPVKALMHRHRELCERAVDPLEIAAGLEAHGITDRTAARFRHRDVFSLAEEMFARVPRDADAPQRPEPATAPRVRAEWILRTLLPGAVAVATLAGLRLTEGQMRLAVAAVGMAALALAVRAALTRGPLSAYRTRPTPTPPATGLRVWTCWLLGYAVLGDGLLTAAATGGPDTLPTGSPDSSWPVDTAVLPALALSCAPAAWSAHLLTAGARRRLTASRGLEEFATAVRPLLLGAFALYLVALAGLHTLTAAALDEPADHARTLTLGALLLLAQLLAAHGFRHAPALVLGVAATAEALAVAGLFAARLPGCGLLAVPVQSLLNAWGAGSVPVLVCGAGALTLLIHAGRRLTRASAHASAQVPAHAGRDDRC